MKKTFPGYYKFNNDEIKQLWDDCLFVLDASVLLNIYRYTPTTRDIFINILNQISDRLWVPHQAALEYHRNRFEVIDKQFKAYDTIKEQINKIKNQFNNDLNSFSKHPFINVDELKNNFESIIDKMNKKLEKDKKKHPNLFDNDTLRESITSILEGKVGSALPEEKLKKIYTLGKERYENKIPPGYNDIKKDGIKKYGDLILWCQIISYTKTKKLPVILVIDDKKEDWWLKFNGKIISPRPELINEMFFKTGARFYMYQSSQFMENAKKYLQFNITPEVIDEVREIEKLIPVVKQEFLNYNFLGQYLLNVGETLTLIEGWAITLLDIDVDGKKVLLSLSKNGEEVSNKVVRVGEHFTYSTDEEIQNKTVFVDFIVKTVFPGSDIKLARKALIDIKTFVL